MLPLGHAAFAYVCYVGVAAATDRDLPARAALLPLALGSQLPDLIDKPLVYYGVLSSGRSAGHSLVGAVVVVGGTVLLTRFLTRRLDASTWTHRVLARTPVPLTVGYLSHILGDSWRAMVTLQGDKLTYLLWPLLAPPQYPSDDTAPWVRLAEAYQRPFAHPQAELIALAVLLFVAIRLYHR